MNFQFSGSFDWAQVPAADESAILDQIVMSLLGNLATCRRNLELYKYDGFKDFTRDIQLNWRSFSLSKSEKAFNFKIDSNN